jgi:hypothetical protein
MFFVTLLFSAVETWMRTQSGAKSLRAILYMDEIYGYLPPQKNPPSKPPLLRMLKQARAFGVGLMLATQNPVDVDYKALSNAGSWFIGKLQTERDKERLLDGLNSASGELNRQAYAKLISALGKRAFILHNVHQKQPALFRTRWAMNYLAGPMTRAQIPDLNALVGASWLGTENDAETATRPQSAGDTSPAPDTGSLASYQPVSLSAHRRVPERRRVKRPRSGSSETRPAIPAPYGEYFLPFNLSLADAFSIAARVMPSSAEKVGIVYHPALFAAGTVRFVKPKYGVDTDVSRAVLVANPDSRGIVRWGEYPVFDSSLLTAAIAPQARFVGLNPPLHTAKSLTALKRDFKNWLYRELRLTARENTTLKVYAGGDLSRSEFMRLCAGAARAKRDAEIDKVSARYNAKLTTLENRLKREERELRQDEEELAERKMEEMGTHAENVLSIFNRRRRRMTTSLTKRRLTQQAKADVEESLDAIDDLEAQMDALEVELKQKLDKIGDRWGDAVNDIREISLAPTKTNVFVDDFGVAWMPYYLVNIGDEQTEVLAFGESA